MLSFRNAEGEYLDSLASKLQDGTLKQEDLQTELEKFYKDAADPEGSVTAATAYILEKTGLTTETPSESPEPMVTEEIINFDINLISIINRRFTKIYMIIVINFLRS